MFVKEKLRKREVGKKVTQSPTAPNTGTSEPLCVLSASLAFTEVVSPLVTHALPFPPNLASLT